MWSSFQKVDMTHDSAPSAVPIDNLYYLLCYATKSLATLKQVPTGAIDGPTPARLYAAVLDEGLARLRRRGFPKRYRERRELTSTPRGRINVATTLARGLLVRRQVDCTVSELIHDHAINRALKAAVRWLAPHRGLSKERQARLRRHVQILGSVADQPLREIDLHLATHGQRLDPLIRFLLQIVRMVQMAALVHPDGSSAHFFDVRRSPQQMGLIFESFLYEFYKREQAEFRVKAPHLNWRVDQEESDDIVDLPTMRTDVVLECADQRILIEAKCTGSMMASNQGGRRKLRSDHLYQLTNYMRHIVHDRPTVGVLLYAQCGAPLSRSYLIDGQRIVVESIDLSLPWQQIHAATLDIVNRVRVKF